MPHTLPIKPTKSPAFTTACSIRAHILCTSAEVSQYKSWSPEFCKEEINNAFNKFSKLVVDPNTLSKEEMVNLGFLEFEKDFHLIPLWLINNLPESCFLTCVDGESRVFNKSEIDNDNRFGMLGWGVKLENKG